MDYKTFKYRLYPTKPQLRLLEQTVETCRRWYNACLEERKTTWEHDQRKVSQYEQLSKVKQYRRENVYAGQIHSHILQVVASDVDQAFQAFFRRVKAGETPGYPNFKRRNRFDSFGLKEYGNGFKLDGRRLRLSGIGRLRMRWHRPIEGVIKTVRIRRQAGEWYACFACEVEAQPLAPTGKDLGIDVGLVHLLATSENEVIANPRWYRAEQKKLRVIQRQVSRRKQGGAHWHTSVLALERRHEHIAKRRKDYLNKLVSDLVVHYDRIAIEDLQITGMVLNLPLSKSILDAGWGYVKQRLIEKAVEAGRQVYPVEASDTSRTCCSCGRLFTELSLADRWVDCRCGLSMDRDVNAAVNILKRAGHARWGQSTTIGLGLPQEAPPL